MFKRLGLAVLAKLGSQQAHGQLDVMDVVQRIRTDWNRYRGQMGQPQTVENVCHFMNGAYGTQFDMNEAADQGAATLNNDQLTALLTVGARMLIQSGSVEIVGRG